MINTFVEEKWKRKKQTKKLPGTIFNDNGNTENGKPC